MTVLEQYDADLRAGRGQQMAGQLAIPRIIEAGVFFRVSTVQGCVSYAPVSYTGRILPSAFLHTYAETKAGALTLALDATRADLAAAKNAVKFAEGKLAALEAEAAK